jgi:hypothetical protein
MDFLDLVLLPDLVLGTILGICAAGLVHWLAPAPEPLLLEGGLVALGFAGGVVVSLLSSRKRKENT